MGVFGQCSLWHDNSMFNWYITFGRSVLTCGLCRIRSGNGTIIFGFSFFGNLVCILYFLSNTNFRLFGS